MFDTIEEFVKSYKSESGFTRNVLNAMTDDSLKQSINSDHRNLGRIAWHITTTLPEMMGMTGLEFGGFDHKALVPATAKEIQDAYDQLATLLLEEIKKNWTDESLQEEIEMYGETWKRGYTLMVLLLHEIHHRGQMTVLMRQAGLVVPSIYGPAKEGWAEYGAPIPEV